MKGDPKVIEILNEVLTAELTAINQYFVHAEMCENWGYDRLLHAIRKESIEEMEGQSKLNQHKSDADHVAFADLLARSEVT